MVRPQGRRMVGLSLSGVLLCAASPAPTNKCGEALAQVSTMSHARGYFQGLEEGKAYGQSQSFQELLDAEAKTRRYEECIRGLRRGEGQDIYYLRAVVGECLKLLPPSQ